MLEKQHFIRMGDAGISRANRQHEIQQREFGQPCRASSKQASRQALLCLFDEWYSNDGHSA